MKTTELKNAQRSENKVKTHVDIENAYDKSRLPLFVKHLESQKLDLVLKKNDVVFIRGAERKISNIVDIYAQVEFGVEQLKILGRCETAVNEFDAVKHLSLLRAVPSDSIVRHILKISAIVADISFIKIAYRCDQCGSEIQNDNICNSGCQIKRLKEDI